MKELYMRDLQSLDSARESFYDHLKSKKNQSPEMVEDFKSKLSFILDQDDSANLRRQKTERIRSRAGSFNDDSNHINIDKSANQPLRCSYDSIMKANVSSFEEPEPDKSMLRKPTPIHHNLPPIIQPLGRRRTLQYKKRSPLVRNKTGDFDAFSCSNISST